MSSSDLIRWSGLAAMVAGALLLIAELLELLPAFDDLLFSELALTDLFTFQNTLYLLGLILLSVGLLGLYARQSRAAGPLGLVGFLVALERVSKPRYGTESASGKQALFSKYCPFGCLKWTR